MKQKKLYITAGICISAQPTFDNADWVQQLVAPENGLLRCIDPDYKQFIDIKIIRRLSRIQKMGIAAALQCLQNAQLENPDGIVVGTGWGCIDSTYQFLDRLYNLQGLPVNPSAFIQSTHNTIAAQIALLLHCHNYNNTITDNSLAFELAMDDACLYLQESNAKKMLLGAVDELTQPLVDILNFVRKPNIQAVLGEGSSFFVLSTQVADRSAELKHFEIGQKNNIIEQAKTLISRFSITQIMTPNEKILAEFQDFSGTKTTFENLCGAYPSSGAFGMWLAVESIIKNFDIKTFAPTSEKQNILMCNVSKNGLGSVTVIGGLE